MTFAFYREVRRREVSSNDLGSYITHLCNLCTGLYSGSVLPSITSKAWPVRIFSQPLFQLDTKVVSVTCAKWKSPGAAKKAPAIDGFEILLEDTVLFPEGGGQGLLPAWLCTIWYLSS